MYNLPSNQPSNFPKDSPSCLLLALFALLISFASCNKQDEEPSPTVPKIKTIYTFQNGQLVNRQSLEMDVLGRLIKISLKNGECTTYTYNDKSILKYEFDAQCRLTNCDTLVLNPQGLVITADHGSKTFTYDKNSYLASVVTRDLPLLFVIKEGNAVTEISKYPNNTVTLCMNWFLPNSVNTIGNENMGISFYGKQDRQLIETKDFILTKRWTYQYEYDARRRVSRCIRTDGISEIYSTFIYYE